jgi:hypothetical protein
VFALVSDESQLNGTDNDCSRSFKDIPIEVHVNTSESGFDCLRTYQSVPLKSVQNKFNLIS